MTTDTGSSAGMGALAGFQQRRLDLADMLRAVLPIAHRYRDEHHEQEIRALLARLAAGRFQLAVAGQFSRGKTTLMNALLGGTYLPTGALPMTSVVTTVRYGTRARALVRSRGSGLPIEVPVSDVTRFVAQASTDRTRMQVAAVEVEIPAELLRLGFEFVDTPGVGSAIAANTAATLGYMPQADAVVFVTGFDSALTEAEAHFLTGNAGQAGNLFLVINKRDLVTESTAAEVTSYVQQWTRQNLGPQAPQVFGLSALDALEAVLQADRRRLAGSGIGPFRSALIRFLTTEQGTASLRAVAAAAENLVSRQHRDIRAGCTSRDAGSDPAGMTASFEARMSDLQTRITAAGDTIAGQVASALPGLLADLRPHWQDSLRQLFGARAVLQPGAHASAVQAALSELTQAGQQLAAGWLDQQAADVREALVAATADGIGSLLELARAPREQGAAAAGLPVFTAGPAGWASEELPDLLLPSVQWVIPSQPARRRARRSRVADDEAQLFAESLTAAAASFADRARSAVQDAALQWAGRIRDDATRQATDEADQFRRYLLTPPRNEDLTVLAALTRQLASFRESLAVPDSGAVREAAGLPDHDREAVHSAGAADSGACVVCGPMEAAVTEYLIGRQLQLATSKDDQARHAEAGGFCPLHTWQYAHMASPVGISAGNARLAAATAAALQRIRSQGSTVGQLATAAGRLARPTGCGACAVLADAEGRAAAAIAADAVPEPSPAVCVRHLAVILAAGPSAEAAAAMTAALANALQRAAHDMRSYALKREALRRGLITADEASAYARTLRLLAGQPALALPWEPDPDGAAPPR